jgi:hypothetical protein
MVKPANPFNTLSEPEDEDEPPTPEEIVIDQFALFLQEKAKIMAANKATFPHLPTKDYLMEEISEMLEDERWSPEDIAHISSLFFCLLATEERP